MAFSAGVGCEKRLPKFELRPYSAATFDRRLFLSEAQVTWVFAIIIVLAVIAVPVLRSAALVVIVVLLGGVAYLVNGIGEQNKQSKERLAIARTLVKKTELTFSEMTLGNEYGSYRLKGTVRNDSSVELLGFVLRVVLQDCPTETNCVTVGEKHLGVRVPTPPRQARGFQEVLSFPNLPQIKQFRWYYVVEDVFGKTS